MLRPTIYGLTCLIVAYAALGAGNQFDGEYLGTEVLTSGSAPPCSPGGIVTFTVSSNNMKFVDSRSREFPLRFDPGPDGSFATAYQDTADSLVDVRGRVVGNVIDADISNYGSGCSHHPRAVK